MDDPRVMRIEDRTALLFHTGESERGQSRSLFCVHPRRKAWMDPCVESLLVSFLRVPEYQ